MMCNVRHCGVDLEGQRPPLQGDATDTAADPSARGSLLCGRIPTLALLATDVRDVALVLLAVPGALVSPGA